MNEELKKKIVMVLVGLFLGADSEQCGSAEHLCEHISIGEIKDILSEMGETELLAKFEKYQKHEDREGNLYDELRRIAYPNGRWRKRW